MTGTTRKKTSSPVPTPLHLLQGLTRTLNEHLSQACEQAQEDARKALEKLTREQQELAEQLQQAQADVSTESPDAEGKAPEKAQESIDELAARLAQLNQARQDADDYARQLQSDVRQTLRLARGLERIDLQATQAIEKRNNPVASTSSGKRRSRSRKPASATAPAAEAPTNND